MSILRPTDLVRFDTPYYALAPIAGLQMKDQAIYIGDLVLLRCNRAEWETVERGYIFKDWYSQYYQANPVFLYKSFTEYIPTEAIQVTMDRLAQDATRLVTALRLYKTGSLLEPIYTVRFLAIDSMYHRIVGPYRTEYLAMPIDNLTWQLETDEIRDIELLYGNLKIIEQTEGTEALCAIIDQFNLSFTHVISSFFSVHILFTALEMLFGGISKKLALQTSSYDRALQILRWWKGDNLDTSFYEFYQNQIYSLRNMVHHHSLRNSKIDLSKVNSYLQIPVMMGIRLLMRLYRTEFTTNILELKQDRGWQDFGPKELLNGSLNCYAHGDPAPLEKIMK